MFIEWIYLFEIFDFQNHDLDLSIQILLRHLNNFIWIVDKANQGWHVFARAEKTSGKNR